MKEILITGMGTSGEWATRLALEIGYACLIYDDRDLTEAGALAEDISEHSLVRVVKAVDAQLLNNVEEVVISPGFAPAHPVRKAAKEAGQNLISEIEFAARQCRGRIFAITGSNGKTTVTGLTAHILKSAGQKAVPCGNFGMAFSQAILDTGGEGDFVVELSSFQLENVQRFRPHFAALLNLTPDHLDRYAHVDEYYRAKMAMFRNMNEENIALLNGDDPVTNGYSRFFPPHLEWIGLSPASLVQVEPDGLIYRGEKLVSIKKTRLRGLHNMYNAAFSAGMALLAGVPVETVRAGIMSFHPISHRLEQVGTRNGVQFYNDSKATNFDSVVKALSSFPSIRWIAGGRFKGGNFSELVVAGTDRVQRAYFIGESAQLFMENLADSFSCRISETLEQAVADAWRDAIPGDVILLAPGCSSYDQFKNYEVRGDQFRKIVKETGNEGNRG